MSEIDRLKSEIDRLNRLIEEQGQRISALEQETTEFRQIEAQLLRAISLTNSEFRALLRSARHPMPS